MKFSRRSFFGLIPGAAIGGKAALAAKAEKLALGGGASGVEGLLPPASFYPEAPTASSNIEWATRRLREFTSSAERVRRWESTAVSTIDPDLASMHSLSLSAKMAIQKQRNFDRNERHQITYWEGVIAGIFD